MTFPDTKDGLIVRKKTNFDGNRINQKIYGIEDMVNLVLERIKKLANQDGMGQNISKTRFRNRKIPLHSIKPISPPGIITQDVKE